MQVLGAEIRIRTAMLLNICIQCGLHKFGLTYSAFKSDQSLLGGLFPEKRRS